MNDPLLARFDRYRPLVVEEMRAVVGENPAGLFAWMRYHLGWEDASGAPAHEPAGKLLRPCALLLATEVVGGAIETTLPAAAAVELVHNFSLIHDDIEDNSPARRGRDTVWTIAGIPQAINAGDGMFTLARLAMHRLLEAGAEEGRVIEAMRELDEACLRLVEGQYLDMAFERRGVVSRDEYLVMTAGKTAAMFAAPFAIGALLGGAPGETVAALRAFGAHLGLAFQAVDDLLDIWGDRAALGKDPGGDILTRKKTYPVLVAIEAAGATSALARRYAEPALAGEDYHDVATLVEAGGGRAAAEALIAEEVEAARAAARSGGFSAEAEQLIDGFLSLATGRE